MITEENRRSLKKLPAVPKVLEAVLRDEFFFGTPRSVLISCVRSSIDHFRSMILAHKEPFKEHISIIDCIVKDVTYRISEMISPNLRRIVNATGVVLHTNLGRSSLPNEVIENLILVSKSYTNLEFDLEQGSRGARHSLVEPALCEISGAEAALVVNNNAAAVLICLDTLAYSREVIISRGELVEIGGSFRIPDVMSKSGSIIKEVGTTNRTYLHDYAGAITEKTGLLLKVHTSNYGIVGFTTSVSLSDLVSLGKCKSLPIMEDLGSGTFIDFSKYGFTKEPTVQESLAAGVDIVTFSGDKLFGGPQAGIILGKKSYIERIKKNPLARALRVDKMTLAALEGTLKLYYDEKKAVERIPTLKMLLQSVSHIDERACDLRDRIKLLSEQFKKKHIHVKIFDMSSYAGGGAMPLVNFPSKCLGIKVDGLSVNHLEKIMRNNYIPIIGRIENNYYIIDLRTIFCSEMDIIEMAFKELLLNFSYLNSSIS